MNFEPPQTSSARFLYDRTHPHLKVFGTSVRDMIGAARAQRPGLDYYEREFGTQIADTDFRQLHDFVSRRASSYQGPALVFVLGSVTRTLSALSDLQLGGEVAFLMATKSAPPGPITGLAARHLSGFDVSNLSEYRTLPANLDGRTVFLTSPRLPDALEPLLAHGNRLIVTVSTPGQSRHLAGLGPPVDFCVRLNPSHLLPHESHFGLSEEQVCEAADRSPHRFVGFHLHSGYSTDNLPETYVAMARWAASVARRHDLLLECLNLGGGICFLSQRELASTVRQIRADLPPRTALYFEPGRPLTEDAGYAIARVLDIDGDNLIVDLSGENHLRWSLPSLVVPRSNGPTRRIRIVGPTCSEGDVLGTFDVPAEQELRVGDILLFGDVVGYSACWNIAFNGVPAAEIAYIAEPEASSPDSTESS